MAPLVHLPAPLPQSSFTLGQIITSPVNTQSPSFTPSCLPQSTSLPLRTRNPQPDTFLRLGTEPSTQTSLPHPKLFFDSLRRDATAQAFFHTAALNRQPLYYVAALQTSKQPQAPNPQQATEATPSVRRVDSADSFEPLNKSSNLEEGISAVELWKVKVSVGAASAPHDLEDIDFEWSYHALLGDRDADAQLAIGLGKIAGRREVRALVGIVDEGEGEEGEKSWSENYINENKGIGGF